MSESLLPMQARGLTVRRRGKVILGPIDLDLSREGFTILIGPNGSGKSTLLKSLHGVERLSDGSVAWNTEMAEAQNHQAYVFQTPIMLRRTVAENLAYPLKLAGVGRDDIRDACTLWAKRIGLGDAMDRPAPRLSGGEQQKLALARALIRAPQMLFLDEPCANLDGRAMREIESLLQTAHAEGTRILMATHDLGQLRRLATDVIFLHAGQVCETGPAQTLLDRPKTAQLTAFLKGDIVE